MAFNQSCYGLLPNEKTDRDFLYYLVKQKIRELQGLSYGSVFDTITTKTFDSLDVEIPNTEPSAWHHNMNSTWQVPTKIFRKEVMWFICAVLGIADIWDYNKLLTNKFGATSKYYYIKIKI